MSYIVKWTSTGLPGGKPAITIQDKTSDKSSTSLVLTGKGLSNYGLFQQENFIKLLENFAGDTPPTPRQGTKGQMWFNTSRNIEFFCIGKDSDGEDIWVNNTLTNFAGPTSPANPDVGQTWFNTSSKVEFYWDGVNWVNPILTNFQGPTSPANPVTGQTWYDTTRDIEFYWDGVKWDNLPARSFSGPTPPVTPSIGQLWYDTNTQKLNVWTGEFAEGGDRWKSAAVTAAVGNQEYSPVNDFAVAGFATRINRLVGSPIGSTETDAYGWGQRDYVPTYDATGQLTDDASLWNVGLPLGQTFPPTFSNNAWAIAISRLRKARRQVGLPESATSPVGFVDDGLPAAPGNTLANIYNDYSPGQGTVANIGAGFGGFGTITLANYYNATVNALTEVEQYRFSLGPAQTQILSGPAYTRARTAPAQTLGVPSAPGSYTHVVTLAFTSKAAADAYFNAGGQIRFTPSFVASGAPTNLELDWKNFLLHFGGFCVDYKGVKTGQTYASPSTPVTYHGTTDGSTQNLGYYDLSATPTNIFVRDVLDLPGAGLYSSTPPDNGGMILKAHKAVVGSEYHVVFSLEYYLRYTENDYVDTSLSGTLTSATALICANNLNVNLPAMAIPTVSHSGTFLTAP